MQIEDVLIDSGATISAISKELVSEMEMTHLIKKSATVMAQIANSTTIQSLGTLELEVEILNTNREWVSTGTIRFHVFQNLPFRMILGSKGLTALRAVLDFEKGQFKFKDAKGTLHPAYCRSKVNEKENLHLMKTITLPVFHEQIVTCQTESGITGSSLWIEPERGYWIKKGYLCAAGVADLIEGKVNILVGNFTRKPLTITAGTVVGSLINTDQESIHTMQLGAKRQEDTKASRGFKFIRLYR